MTITKPKKYTDQEWKLIRAKDQRRRYAEIPEYRAAKIRRSRDYRKGKKINHSPGRRSRAYEWREVIINFVRDRDGNNCCYCDEEISDAKTLTLDHKIPLSIGGPNIMENMRLAHGFCNTSAGGVLRRKYSDDRLKDVILLPMRRRNKYRQLQIAFSGRP